MTNFKQPRIVSPNHLAHIRTMPCCSCQKPTPSEAHHLNTERGMGMKAPDNYTVPLCSDCHTRQDHAVHKAGSKNEGAWFKERGIADHLRYALDLWSNSPAFYIPDLADMGRKLKRKRIPMAGKVIAGKVTFHKPMDGTMASGWKRKMNGEVVKR